MNGAKDSGITTALCLIEETLKKQCDAGLTEVDYNDIRYYGHNNLWGYLDMIVERNRALAERVRQSFLKKSLQEALALVEKIHRECFEKWLQSCREMRKE